jgi:hypothetical protein
MTVDRGPLFIGGGWVASRSVSSMIRSLPSANARTDAGFRLAHSPHLRCRAVTQQARPPDRRQQARGDIGVDAGLEQMNRDQMRWLDKSLILALTGPVGGNWRIDPAGKGRLAVTQSTDTTSAAATITGVSTDFPAWATNRIAWRTAGLTIAGDTDYAETFLDALHII